MFNLCFSPFLRGTQFTFKNGYTVSVQWGAANYCGNHSSSLPMVSYEDCRTCSDAEIAVLSPDGDFVPPERYGFPFQMDDVVAHVTPDRVVDVMAFVKAW